MRSLIVFCSLIIALPCIARDVYKWTSDDGETLYSDTYRFGAEKLSISVGQGQQKKMEEKRPIVDSDQTSTSTDAYQIFKIAQPSNDETIRNDEGVVTVGLSLSPMLLPGHVIHVYFDGVKLNTDLTTTQFNLNDLNRGTHSLQAKVVNAEGKPQISTPTVSFHLLQSATGNP